MVVMYKVGVKELSVSAECGGGTDSGGKARGRTAR
jgi:hypothetical protein